MQPHVVLLQETKVAEDQFPAQELADAGYDAVHHSGGQWAGVAILARSGLGLAEATTGLPGEARPEEARWIEAAVPGLGVRAASVYVVNGREVGSPTFDEKLRFLDALARRAGALRGQPLVLGGDFNIAPADEDVYDPAAFAGSTHVTEEERSRLQVIERAGALTDAYRALHPRRAPVHLVGLSPGPFPPRAGSADRPAARRRAAGTADPHLRDRPRLPQGHEAQRPRAPARGAGAAVVTDAVLRLADGRALGYAEYGDPGGRPLVYHHGGLSCRRDIAFADARCRQLGIRVIAPDRPGIGLSDRRSDHRVGDCARDVEELADALGLERFAVLGWSAGGPYVLACAHTLGDRVSAAATAGGAGPPDRTSVAQLGMGLDRVLFPVARWAPPLGRAILGPGRLLPASIGMRQMLKEVRSAGDRAVLETLDPGELRSWFTTGARRGTGGMVDDYRALVRDWGFALEDVAAPVRLWQGEQDVLVPMAEAQFVHGQLPASTLTVVPGIGHFVLFRHLDDVLAGLGLTGGGVGAAALL